MKNLHLIAGLPRSGSTLLCNLLNMNSKFHATPTSYVIDMLRNEKPVYVHWREPNTAYISTSREPIGEEES